MGSAAADLQGPGRAMEVRYAVELDVAEVPLWEGWAVPVSRS